MHKDRKEYTLAEACEINPKRKIKLQPNTEVSFIPMPSVSNDGSIEVRDTRLYSEVSKGFTYFENGDVLVAKITPCFENGKGALAGGLSSGVGFGSTEFHVLRAKEGFCPAYINYLTRTHRFRNAGAANMQGSSGHRRVPTDFLSGYKHSWPEFEEQQRIAGILSTWEKAINAYDRLIALKEKQKRGLMSDLFSRISGEEVSLGDIANIISGNAFKSKNFNIEGASIPVIRMSDFKNGSVSLENAAKVRTADVAGLERYRLEEGDFVFGMSGSLTNYGWISKSEAGAYLNQRVGKITPKKDHVHPLFLTYLFLSDEVQKNILAMAEGAAQLNISITALKNIKVTLPEFSEQKKIASSLLAWNRAVGALTQKRELLKKQKQGLMQLLLA
tara:strand:+ start:3398 stop:4561 length:1164 start_codon:yes stop_codon:yes gene_type:complete